MGSPESLRQAISWEEFDYQALLGALQDYAHPRDKISDLLAKDIIIRVKKGLYVFGDSYRNKPYSREILANLIYGPSCISLEYALLGLWRSKFFEKAAFYGGTALRILYGLNRFSEDLDFSLLEPMTDFDLERYSVALERELAAFGFEVRVEKKNKSVETAVQSAFPLY